MSSFFINFQLLINFFSNKQTTCTTNFYQIISLTSGLTIDYPILQAGQISQHLRLLICQWLSHFTNHVRLVFFQLQNSYRLLGTVIFFKVVKLRLQMQNKSNMICKSPQKDKKIIIK